MYSIQNIVRLPLVGSLLDSNLLRLSLWHSSNLSTKSFRLWHLISHFIHAHSLLNIGPEFYLPYVYLEFFIFYLQFVVGWWNIIHTSINIKVLVLTGQFDYLCFMEFTFLLYFYLICLSFVVYYYHLILSSLVCPVLSKIKIKIIYDLAKKHMKRSEGQIKKTKQK